MKLPFARHDRDSVELKMTPMIDVIFLLLIFFVCTSSFRRPEQLLPTNLSQSGSTSQLIDIDPTLEDLDDILIHIEQDTPGRIYWTINRKPYGSLQEVGQVLLAIAVVRSDLPVTLDVDGDVPIDQVIDVYDLSRRAGLTRIRFAAGVE